MTSLRLLPALLLLSTAGARAQELEVKVEPSRLKLDALLVVNGALKGHPPDAAVQASQEGTALRLRGRAEDIAGVRALIEALDAPPDAGGPRTIRLWGGRVGVVLAAGGDGFAGAKKKLQARPPGAGEEPPTVTEAASVARVVALGVAEALVACGFPVDPKVAPARAAVTSDAPDRRAVTFTPRRLLGADRLSALQAVVADALAGAPVEVTIEEGHLTLAGPPAQVDGVVRLAEALDDPAGTAARPVPLWDGRAAAVIAVADADAGSARFDALAQALGLRAGPGQRKRGQPAVAWSPALLRVVAAGAPADLEKATLPVRAR